MPEMPAAPAMPQMPAPPAGFDVGANEAMADQVIDDLNAMPGEMAGAVAPSETIEQASWSTDEVFGAVEGLSLIHI